ncbi:hypothetical protein [Pseudomonas sp. JUb52]|uniref:hypothetical protein n=1 Tax=Pseudomonas sp. JUb52 TaxID=2485127 RepID=UPI00104D3E56|nr:hypothetical protein [Pseudomonas sp. JUb52]TCQ92659.1 hypothetical protein EC839_102449 [Pseudomonas sp. JUb52]
MNVFNKMAALALLSTASYTAMAAEINERRAQAAPQPKAAHSEVVAVQRQAPAGWDQVLDPQAYGQASVRYQARAVDPALLRAVNVG